MLKSRKLLTGKKLRRKTKISEAKTIHSRRNAPLHNRRRTVGANLSVGNVRVKLCKDEEDVDHPGVDGVCVEKLDARVPVVSQTPLLECKHAECLMRYDSSY